MMFKTMMFATTMLVGMAWSTGSAAISCTDGNAAQPLPVRTTPVPPLYAGMQGRPAALASPRTLLAESRDESLALDVVLMRLRLEACANQAGGEYANYVPKTEFDNTPYRFNMEKGKKFSAAEFDAWMKSRGVRIVPARPATGGAAATADTQPAAAGEGTVSD